MSNALKKNTVIEQLLCLGLFVLMLLEQLCMGDMDMGRDNRYTERWAFCWIVFVLYIKQLKHKENLLEVFLCRLTG